MLRFYSLEFVVLVKAQAPVAQLDSVSDSDSEGRGFESRRAYHVKPLEIIKKSRGLMFAIYRRIMRDVPKRVPRCLFCPLLPLKNEAVQVSGRFCVPVVNVMRVYVKRGGGSGVSKAVLYRYIGPTEKPQTR